MNDMIDFIPDHKRSEDIIFIGISPSSKTKPFENGSFNTLRKWCESVGLYEWDFHNLIPNKVNCLDKTYINHNLLIEKIKNKNKIIALGGYVSGYLTKNKIDHLKIDHPSPRNRNLNNLNYVQTLVLKLKEYIND